MRYRYALLALFICAMASTTAHAQTTYVWKDANPSWTTPSDWTPNGPADWFTPQQLSGATASFPSQAVINNQPNIDNNVQVRGITMDDTQAVWSLTGSSGILNIGQDGLTITAPGADSKTSGRTAITTVSAPISLPVSQTWTIGEGVTVSDTGSLSGPGNLTKAGAGRLALSGPGTNTGSITASGGVLVLAGNRGANKGTIYASGGAVQRADGTIIGGSIDFETTFQASQSGTAAAQTNSPNLFGDSEEATIMGNLTMGNGTHVEFDIDGPNHETGYDRIDVDQDIIIGDADLDMVEGDFTPAIGEIFFIVNNEGPDPITGQFTNAPEGSIIKAGSISYTITYHADVDTNSLTGGNDVALVAVSLPEPTSGACLVGIAMLAGRRSSRKTCH